MISYDDIKKVVQSDGFESIKDAYNNRKMSSSNANNLVANEFLCRYSFGLDFLEYNSEATKLFLVLLNHVMCNGSSKDKMRFIQGLKHYGYNSTIELLQLIHFIDNYFEGEIGFSKLQELSKCSTTLRSIDCTIYPANITTIFKDDIINFSPANRNLGVEPIDVLKRRNYCHHMTSAALRKYPNLYGAYYYIANYFRGYIEHSVIIDYDTGLVHDLANNITLPLDAWEHRFSKPTFIIKGSTFAEYSKMFQDDFDLNLNMIFLEETRRRLKK